MLLVTMVANTESNFYVPSTFLSVFTCINSLNPDNKLRSWIPLPSSFSDEENETGRD